VKRIIVTKAGRKSQSFVIVRAPFPDPGDICTIKGEDWIVKSIQDADDAIEIKFPKANARKVFP
jgi:hypothetical protein